MLFWTGMILLAVLAIFVAALPLWMKGERQSAVVAAVAVLAVALGGYLLVGAPGQGMQTQAQASAQSDQAPSLEAMVDKLAERLQGAPEDPQGWTMLGRSYIVMGRYADAAEAFRKAIEHSPNQDPALSLSFAEALVLADNRSLEGEAGQILERVLAQLPDDPRALWYGGLAAQARGEEELASQRWQHMLELDVPGPLRQVAEQRLLELDPAAVDAELIVNVGIAPALREAVPQQGSLFVSLRPLDAPRGTPPLAARRLDVFSYPTRVVFRAGDVLSADALPQQPLEVRARIVVGDNALQTAGGIEGIGRWDGESAAVEVTIDRRTQ